MKVRHKFLIMFTPLLALIFAFGLGGISTFFSINQIVVNLQEDIAPTALSLMEFRKVLTSLEGAINARVVQRSEIEQLVTRVKGLVQQHASRGEGGEAADKADDDMRLRAIRVMSLARYILNVTENNWQEGEAVRVSSNIQQEQRGLGLLLDDKLVAHLRELSMAEKNIAGKYHFGVLVVWLGLAFALLTVVFMVLYLARTVLTPIKTLQEGAKQIGDGRLDYPIAMATGDEFEELAVEFNAMARKLGESYDQLDRKVVARTEELSLANKELRKEIGERLQAEAEQQKAEEQVRGLTQDLLHVQEVERKRIALDLHDNVAQELSAMKVLTEALCTDPAHDADQIRRQMREWVAVLNQCVGTIRELSYNLMPPGLEHLGIKTVLSSYCREFGQKNGLLVEFSSAGMERLSLGLDYDIAINLYRLTQEALNNIKKHAAAGLVRVRLLAAGSRLLLQIEDDGQGCNLEQVRGRAMSNKRLGLLGMEERVKLLGGSLKIHSQPCEGMKIFIEIPWEKTDAGEKKNTTC